MSTDTSAGMGPNAGTSTGIGPDASTDMRMGMGVRTDFNASTSTANRAACGARRGIGGLRGGRVSEGLKMLGVRGAAGVGVQVASREFSAA